jgi:hypothetical protein
MATKQTTQVQSTTEVPPSKFTLARMTDDEVFQGGQPNKFIGTILSILAYPQKGKDTEKHYGYVGVRILPDEDSGFEEFTRSYLGGFFNKGVPSKDGLHPAGGDDNLYLALASGKAELDEKDGPVLLGTSGEYDRHVNPNHPNVGPHWLGSLAKDIGFSQFRNYLQESDEKKLADQDGSLSWAVGLRCRFDLVDQEGGKKKGAETGSEKAQSESGEAKKTYQVLVPTMVLERVDVKALSSGKTTTGGTTNKPNGAAEPASDELKNEIVPLVLQFLAEKGPSKKGTLMAKIPALFPKERKAYVSSWLKEDENLGDINGTIYDADPGTKENPNPTYSVLELEG